MQLLAAMPLMPPWMKPPIPPVEGQCPPHRIKYTEDGRAIWYRVCPDCNLSQMSATGPVVAWTHYCRRALGHTVIVVWWPNERFERTNYVGDKVRFCQKCDGKGCKECGNSGTVG